MNDLADIIERFWKLSEERIPVARGAIAAMRAGRPKEVFVLKDVVHGIKGEAQLLRLRSCATLMEAADRLANALIHGAHTEEACDALDEALDVLQRLCTERSGVPVDRTVGRLDRARGAIGP